MLTQLTNEELALIELKREEDANAAEAKRIADEKAELERKQKEAAHIIALTKKHVKMVDLASKLIKADKNQVLTVEWKIHTLTGVDLPVFKFNAGRNYTINIGEHIVHDPGCFRRKRSNGLKFDMPKGLNEWGTKWVKNPATVLKNVVEMIELHQTRTAAAKKQAAITDTITAQLVDLFGEDSTVEFLRAGSYTGHKYTDTWSVKNGRGEVIYRARPDETVEGGQVPQVMEVRPHADLLDTIAGMILND